MRSVSGTERKPAVAFRVSGHSTECTSTIKRLPLPSPNHSSASGSSAIAGSGSNIEVEGPDLTSSYRVVQLQEMSTMVVR